MEKRGMNSKEVNFLDIYIYTYMYTNPLPNFRSEMLYYRYAFVQVSNELESDPR